MFKQDCDTFFTLFHVIKECVLYNGNGRTCHLELLKFCSILTILFCFSTRFLLQKNYNYNTIDRVKNFAVIRKIWSQKSYNTCKWLKSRILYYHNSTASFNTTSSAVLLICGDIHPNLGPSN